jgi:hypothetical protein
MAPMEAARESNRNHTNAEWIAGQICSGFTPPSCAVRHSEQRGSRSASLLANCWLAPLILVGVASAACSSLPAASPTFVPGSTTRATAAAPAVTVAPTTTTTTEQPGWTPISLLHGAIAVDGRAVSEPDGHVVTVYRFRAGQTRFALHVGTSDPPTGRSVIGPDSGATIGPGEAPVLLAAFNGGFKTNAGAGGFELDSQLLLPLQTGLASLVVDADGSAHLGVWGQGLPAPGEQVASVRQNLPPLVVKGQPSPVIGNIATWGATLGGGAVVARSSLGEDASGNLIYAASIHAVPSDLANAQISVGAVNGMELDINPQWVQLDVAASPGAPLVSGIPAQSRPANQYQVGWTRDFVTVLAGK